MRKHSIAFFLLLCMLISRTEIRDVSKTPDRVVGAIVYVSQSLCSQPKNLLNELYEFLALWLFHPLEP